VDEKTMNGRSGREEISGWRQDREGHEFIRAVKSLRMARALAPAVRSVAQIPSGADARIH
jgi:hypothetical protein